jgi:NADPH2:quinone reductase
MRAAVCLSYGPPEGVITEEIPEPELGPGQARVRVNVAALNFPDVLVVAGEYQVKVPPPFVPGSELAGEVIEVAEDVTDVVVGQRVFASTLFGAFAEQIVLSAAALTAIPPGTSEQVAAAFGVCHRTSYHALRSVAVLRPGEQLVVLGAGGGVGLAAIQLGALLGANVTAVASSIEKLEVAGAAGATGLIDHRAGDLRQALRDMVPGGADVVIDPVGGDLAEPALRSLRFGGRFVTIGYASGVIPRIPLNLVLLKGVHILGFEFGSFARNMPDERQRNELELMELLSSHRVVPHIGASYPLEEVARALRVMADGGAIGKILIDVTGSVHLDGD